MKRTAEELVALREQRERKDRVKLQEERRRAAGRTKRRKMRAGDLIDELGLTTQELRGLVLDAQSKATREKWAKMGKKWSGTSDTASAGFESGLDSDSLKESAGIENVAAFRSGESDLAAAAE